MIGTKTLAGRLLAHVDGIGDHDHVLKNLAVETRKLIKLWEGYAQEYDRLVQHGGDLVVDKVGRARVGGAAFAYGEAVRGLARGWGLGG